MRNVDAIKAVMKVIQGKYTVIYEEPHKLWNNFIIKECTNWLFGLNCYDEDDDNIKKTLSYFCQHKQNCRKFNPSWSYIKKDITVYDIDYNGIDCIEGIDYIINSLDFICKHPIRAWAEDYYGYMTNCVYASSYKIFFQWIKYRMHEGKVGFIQDTLNKALLRWFKRNIVPYICEFSAIEDGNPPIKGKVRVFDYGDFNGYRVIYVVDEQEERPHGFYDWFTDEDKDCKLSQKFNNLCDKYNKIADFFGSYWLNPFDHSYQYLYEKEIPYEIASEV